MWWSERRFWIALVLVIGALIDHSVEAEAEAEPNRLVVDTDFDTDDLFALFYLLKLNTSQFKLEAVTINANQWTNAGHSVNQIYDILYMMGRDDIVVGVGGEGGILENSTIEPNVGGYHPIIEQGTTTAGYCRYRQTIPLGGGGRLDRDTNYGIRKAYLPQGGRRYSPLRQPTTQQVLIDKVSKGPITVLLLGSHTNFAIFLMSNPSLKKNIKHIYVMGGSVRSKNRGNIYDDFTINPNAEFNIFIDPFAAYQVLHSGIPITLIPLDATNTIPLSENLYKKFEGNRHTHEAEYCFRALKLVRDTWIDNQFFSNYFMWDSFAAGVAASAISSYSQNGENEYSEMEYMNITVITSNKPYGVSDGSNPLFNNGLKAPTFYLTKGGVHSGHVQTGLRDPFCIAKNGEEGRCEDGTTKEVTGPEGVRVLVATKAKPSKDIGSDLNKDFLEGFLDVLNRPQQAGRFNLSTEFPYYKQVLYKPDFKTTKLGKPVVFDMDMSAGDFLALLYLLKVPVEIIDLKAIIVSPNGWANAATIDVVYDILHMMGRDDIPVGLGEVLSKNQSDPIFPDVGGCKYAKAIPHGSGGFLDSDTLYGLARNLPRSPRRYTAENSVKFGAPRDTEHPELRQPLALDIWDSVVKNMNRGSKITVLTNGPLTNLAKIISSRKNITSLIQDVYIVGGHISKNKSKTGNIFTVSSNKYAEFNIYLDPLAAKTVFENSNLNITLIPLDVQRKTSSFPQILQRLSLTIGETHERSFALDLLSTLHRLQKTHFRYHHMDTFLGEVLGSVLLGGDHSLLEPSFDVEVVKVIAEGVESKDGQIVVDKKKGKLVKILGNVNCLKYYDMVVNQLSIKKQSGVIGSFDQQRKIWNTSLPLRFNKFIHRVQ